MSEPLSKYADSAEGLLAARCLSHDRDAWSALVKRFTPLIFSGVHHTLGRHHVPAETALVDDLFHQVFLALYDKDYKKLRQWSKRCSLASWVRLITSSVVVDALRRRRPESSLEEMLETTSVGETLSTSGDTALGLLERAEEVAQVRAAMARLGTADQELLSRLFVDEATAETVAQELGIRPGALYTRKNRALARLRVEVQRETALVTAARRQRRDA